MASVLALVGGHVEVSDTKAEYNRRWRQANRERVAEYNRAYREAHPEREATRHKAYHEANREHVAARHKRVRDADPERCKRVRAERGWEAESAVVARGSGRAAARAERAERRQSK
jgi:hypothetical protein